MSRYFQIKTYALLLGVSLFTLSAPIMAYASDEEEEKIEGRRNPQKELYERWAPLQGVINTQRVLFRKEILEGEGALGFCAFSFGREKAVTQLLEHKEDEKVRELVQQEIFAAFLKGTLPKQMQRMKYKSLRRDYFSAQKKLENIVSDLNEEYKTEGKDVQYFDATLKEADEGREILSTAIKDLEEKKKKSRDHCASVKVFEDYVTAYLKENLGWLTYAKDQTSLIDALSYLNQVDLFIWQRQNKQSKELCVTHQYKGERAKNKIHLLHEEGKESYAFLVEVVEKDLLFELSHKVENLEVKNERLEIELLNLKVQKALAIKVRDQDTGIQKQSIKKGTEEPTELDEKKKEVAKSQIEDLITQLETTKQSLANLQAEKVAAEAEYERRIQEQKESISECDDKIEDLEAQIKALRLKIEGLEEDVSDQMESIVKANGKASGFKKELKKIKKEILNNEKASKKDALAEIKRLKAGATVAVPDMNLYMLKANLAGHYVPQADHDAAQAKIQELTLELEKLRAELTEAQADVHDQILALKRLRREKRELQKQIDNGGIAASALDQRFQALQVQHTGEILEMQKELDAPRERAHNAELVVKNPAQGGDLSQDRLLALTAKAFNVDEANFQKLLNLGQQARVLVENGGTGALIGNPLDDRKEALSDEDKAIIEAASTFRQALFLKLKADARLAEQKASPVLNMAPKKNPVLGDNAMEEIARGTMGEGGTGGDDKKVAEKPLSPKNERREDLLNLGAPAKEETGFINGRIPVKKVNGTWVFPKTGRPVPPKLLKKLKIES